MLPRLASSHDWYWLDVREQLHEFLHVVFVGGDARQPRRRVLGVVEGDEHLDVVRFGRPDPVARLVERVGVHGRVVRGDVAGDFGVQLRPVGIAEHLDLLIADAREEGRRRVCARRVRGLRRRWRQRAGGDRRGLGERRRAASAAQQERDRERREDVAGGVFSYGVRTVERQEGFGHSPESYAPFSRTTCSASRSFTSAL